MPSQVVAPLAMPAACQASALSGVAASQEANRQQAPNAGSLQAFADGKPAGECPLKHTSVKAAVSGFLSRVTVTQDFENPFKDKIEAFYSFPLPQAAAVDDMTMLIGDRTVKGKIMRREEAQTAYAAGDPVKVVVAPPGLIVDPEESRIGIGEGFHRIPVHQREVVVVGVLGVGYQTCDDVPAVFDRQTATPRGTAPFRPSSSPSRRRKASPRG